MNCRIYQNNRLYQQELFKFIQNKLSEVQYTQGQGITYKLNDIKAGLRSEMWLMRF